MMHSILHIHGLNLLKKKKNNKIKKFLLFGGTFIIRSEELGMRKQRVAAAKSPHVTKNVRAILWLKPLPGAI